jgi:hypothetical protein
MVIIVYELLKLFADACLTAYPRIMEMVNSYLEGVKPLFNQASVGVFD